MMLILSILFWNYPTTIGKTNWPAEFSKNSHYIINNALITAYHPKCRGCIGITKSGLPAIASKHYLAADLRYWDIGDRFYIPITNEIYTVQDTGGAIKGKWRFDILVENQKQAIDWGKKKIKIYKL